MAIAVDASTPARWTGTTTSITSGSFTAPADALLVVCGSTDGGGGMQAGQVSDTGGLTWTERVRRDISETTAGHGGCVIYTARTVSGVARTVTWNPIGSGADRKSAKLYVLTGVDVGGTPVDSVTASNEGNTTSNSFSTTSVTPGAGGLLFVVGVDWNQLGGAGGTTDTSSDLTPDAANYSGAVDVISGYKACTSGVGVTGNLDAPGTSAADWKWCQVVVRAAATAALPFRQLVVPQAVKRASFY